MLDAIGDPESTAEQWQSPSPLGGVFILSSLLDPPSQFRSTAFSDFWRSLTDRKTNAADLAEGMYGVHKSFLDHLNVEIDGPKGGPESTEQQQQQPPLLPQSVTFKFWRNRKTNTTDVTDGTHYVLD